MKKYSIKQVIKSNIFLIIFFIVVIIIIFNSNYRINLISESPSITTGIIYNEKYGNGGWLYLYYSFEVNGKINYGKKTTPYGNKEGFFNRKQFPVIYKEDQINLNDLLIEPKDFKKYDLDFPDSLKWILPHLQ